jgi:glycosyltransferase involved in cell wall biosynthesis
VKRPRLLILTTYYYPFIGGVESHARRLVSYLREHGFEVLILTKRVHRHTPFRDSVDAVPVYRLPPAGERTSLQKWLMIPLAIMTMLRLRKQFELIYCPGYRGIGVAAVLAGKLLRRPMILKSGNTGILSCQNWDAALSRWSIDPHGRLGALLKWPVHRTYAAATAFACISHEIMEEAWRCQIPPSRVHYLPESVDATQFRPPQPGEREQIRAAEGWPPQHLLCMYVGRLSTEKGIIELLEAWRQLDASGAVLVVVGPDMPGHHMDAGPTVRQYLAAHSLKDRVVLCGPREDVWQLLRAADLFIQPSHYEAFGLSVIEAMATGLPVVATCVGGMRDYLVDGVNALLCEPGSPVALAGQIHRLLGDASLRQRLGREARATVERNFDEAVIFERFAHLFREAARESV